MSPMTEQQRQNLLATYFDLESNLQEYRKTLLWLTHGNHKEYPPTEQETLQLLKELQGKISALFREIDTQIQPL
jgi:hypothetical protein